jgi:hypothetical protein
VNSLPLSESPIFNMVLSYSETSRWVGISNISNGIKLLLSRLIFQSSFS